MFRVCVLFMICYLCSCAQHNSSSTAENKTVNVDSIKKAAQQQFYDVLAALDSTIGASRNTLADSLQIEQLKDSATKLHLLLDSMGVAE